MTEPTTTDVVFVTARAKRREVVNTKVPEGKKHPWGIRNRALIDARRAARSGQMAEAAEAESEAAAIAPLTKVERAGIAKAAKKFR